MSILCLSDQGHPLRWISVQAAIEYHATNSIAFEVGEKKFTFRGGINAITGKQSIISTSEIVAIKGFFNPGRIWLRTPAVSNKILFSRDHYTCAYCGDQYSPAGKAFLTRDHIIPQSRGGKDEWNNIITACTWCNNKKDNKTPDEYGVKLRFLPYVPNKLEKLVFGRHKITSPQAEYLMRFMPSNSRSSQYLQAFL